MRFLRNSLLGLASVGVLVAVPVLAQEGAGDYPAACEEAKVSRGDHERAHTVFLSGKQFLEESNYDKAISYFKDAYSIDCSVHAMLPIIATAYERKGDMAEAIRALGEYLVRAPGAPDSGGHRAPDPESQGPTRARAARSAGTDSRFHDRAHFVRRSAASAVAGREPQRVATNCTGLLAGGADAVFGRKPWALNRSWSGCRGRHRWGRHFGHRCGRCVECAGSVRR